MISSDSLQTNPVKILHTFVAMGPVSCAYVRRRVTRRLTYAHDTGPTKEVKGALHPEIYLLNIIVFIIFISNMCLYKLKKQKLFKNLKIPQGGCATPPNVSKLGVSGVKDTAKTNKD